MVRFAVNQPAHKLGIRKEKRMSFKQALILVVVLLALASAGDAVSGVVKSGQLDWYELTKSVVLLLTSAFIAWKMEE